MSFEELDDIVQPDRHDPYDDFSTVNPATGLPMMGGIGGLQELGVSLERTGDEGFHQEVVNLYRIAGCVWLSYFNARSRDEISQPNLHTFDSKIICLPT